MIAYLKYPMKVAGTLHHTNTKVELLSFDHVSVQETFAGIKKNDSGKWVAAFFPGMKTPTIISTDQVTREEAASR